jgi:hypothetical protein
MEKKDGKGREINGHKHGFKGDRWFGVCVELNKMNESKLMIFASRNGSGDRIDKCG